MDRQMCEDIMLKICHKGDRVRYVRRKDSVMTETLEALAREKERKKSADATAAGRSMHPPSEKPKVTRAYLRNHFVRRENERRTHERVRKRQYVTSLLETLVSPSSDGTESGN